MASTTQITGQITDVFQAETFSSRFAKKVIWVKEQGGRYENHYSIEFQNENIKLVDKFRRGDVVTCEIEVRGNKSSKNGKDVIYTSLVCTDIGFAK